MTFNLGKSKHPERDVYDYAWHIYLNIQEMIKLADQKVYVSATVSLIMVTLASFKFETIATFEKSGQSPDIIKALIGFIAEYNITSWLLILFSLSTGFFIFYALRSLRARGSSHTGEDVPNLIFFGHIAARKDPSEYAESYLDVTSEEAIEDLCYQIYEVAVIATKKLKYYNMAWWGLLSQMIFFIIILIIYFGSIVLRNQGT